LTELIQLIYPKKSDLKADTTALEKEIDKGTRIPVAVIIGSLAGGMTYDEVIQEYAVTQEQILASLTYFS